MRLPIPFEKAIEGALNTPPPPTDGEDDDPEDEDDDEPDEPRQKGKQKPG